MNIHMDFSSETYELGRVFLFSIVDSIERSCRLMSHVKTVANKRNRF